MRSNRSKRLVAGAALLALVTTGVAWSTVANGQEARPNRDDMRTCTQATLHGTYGNQLSGLGLTPAGTVATDFAANGVEEFDGAGRTHGTFTSQNRQLGAIVGTFAGTYTVMADCSGAKDLTITVTQPSGLPPLHAHYDFVLVDGGRQLLYHGTTVGLNSVEQGQLVRQ
jgi:hypothetical protein